MRARAEIRLLTVNQRGRCYYCERMMTLGPHPTLKATRDHVVPRAEGGFDHMSNYVAACLQCNGARGTIPADLFRRYVRRFGPPQQSAMALSNHYKRRVARHIAWEEMEPAVINDVLGQKLRDALAQFPTTT
ncbi:MAG: HNH endonuclease [Rhizobiales bacterium]|nr:HNH endonuclease [Hyphomicrobiales bacterium]